MANAFDKFDSVESNPFDKFDDAPVKASSNMLKRYNSGTKETNDGLKNVAGGLYRSAVGIGGGLAYPLEAMGMLGGKDARTARKSNIDREFSQNYDVDSNQFKTGKIAGDIALTYPVGGMLGMGAKALGATRLGNALSSGGFNLGARAAKAMSGQGFVNAGTRIAGAGGTAAVQGSLIDPNSTLQSAAYGAAFPVLGKAGGQVGKLFGSGQIDDLAKTAIEKYRIPLDKATASNSKIAKATKSVLDDTLIGVVGNEQKELVKQAFNREVGNTFDAGAPKLTPDVMAQAKDKISSAYDKVWNKNNFFLDRQYADEATNLIQEASTKLNPEQVDLIQRNFNNLINQSKNGEIKGAFVNNWQSELRKIAESEKGLHKEIINNLRQKTLQTFKRNISPEDAKLLTETNLKNRAFKTVEPLMNKVEAGVGGRDVGDVPAGLLSSAVLKQYGNRVSQSPFGDLPKIGSKYLVDRVERTGGGNRALIQNLLAGGAGGAAINLGVISPLALAGIPMAYGTQKLLSMPKIVPKKTSDEMIRLLLAKQAQRALPAILNQD